MCDIYAELSTDRSGGGFGIGPIPGSVIRVWCVDNELDPTATGHVKHVVALVDAETLRRARRAAAPKK